MSVLHGVELVVGSLLVGAGATSYAEYHFKYNLVDLIIEKVKGLFGKAKADVVAVEKKL